MADRLSASQIYTLLIRGGFSPDQAVTMTAIAQAESARDPGAVGDVGLQNRTWGPSVGLFQIRTLRAETGTGGDRDIEHLTGDPEAQVRAALAISGGGRDFRPWSTFTSGSYRRFLDDPVRDGADLSGVLGSSSRAGAAPAAGSSGDDPFGIERGRPAVAVVDGDGDGLTDRFEKLLGTDERSADTDEDGLSDAYETGVGHTDPLSAKNDPARPVVSEEAREAGFGGYDTLDTDEDGLSDGYERRHDLDPLTPDSDDDGVPDGDEAAH